jgi:hypothetical protein
MSSINDPSQGQVEDPKNPQARAVPARDGKAIIRAVGAAVNRKDAEDHAPRPPQRVTGQQDWRRG